MDRRVNGRHRQEHYKPDQPQWMMPQHTMKEHAPVNILSLMNERDTAIRERNQAINEKKNVIAERDLAILQRDAAIAERNSAMMERDNALAALELARASGLAVNNGRPFREIKYIQNHDHIEASPPQLADAPYDHIREMHITDAYPVSAAPESFGKVQKAKRSRKQNQTSQMKLQKSRKKTKKAGGIIHSLVISGRREDIDKVSVTKNDWKVQDLGLNQVAFDDSTMPAPGCSCTGKFRQCYKWGSGGWQSSCCTTTMSMYPLPVMPNKRHARMGGRKMSGNVFTKLISRLAADGHDLSNPVDLKEHWAKHGTNRYITIK